LDGTEFGDDGGVVAKRVGFSLALVVALAVGATVTAGALAVRIQPITLLKLGGSVSPHELPKAEAAPATIAIRGRISTSDGSLPAQIREAVAEFDKSGVLDAHGLAVCTTGQLEAAGVAGRKACRNAIVGTGSAEAMIGDGPQRIPIGLTLFNGGARGGMARILIRSSASEATPEPVVVAVDVRRKRSGWSGSMATVEVPRLDDGYATLVGFDLQIKRLFRYKGASKSYLSASCPDGQLRAQMKVTLANGASAQDTAVAPCK
jgi:hypothetical protein